MIRLILFSFVFFLVYACTPREDCFLERPILHFTEGVNWTGEPTGLVYEEGYYHLFYQTNQVAPIFGSVQWSRAISLDLVHWETGGEIIFSGEHRPNADGCVLSDPENRSGLGSPNVIPFIAYYSYLDDAGGATLYWAYSLDKGVHWQEGGVLLLDIPDSESAGYPKVSRTPDGDEWIMTLSVGNGFRIYTSEDALHWKYGCSCPEILQEGMVCHGVECLPIRRSDGTGFQWTLLVDVENYTPVFIPRTRYLFGDYADGCFVLTQNKPLWINYGMDHTSGITCQTEKGDQVHIAWMNSWDYANLIPYDDWRGQMTLPVSLSVQQEGNHFILQSKLPAAIDLLSVSTLEIPEIEVNRKHEQNLKTYGRPFIIRLYFDNEDDMAIWKSTEYGIRLKTSSGQILTVGYQNELSCFYMDRAGLMPDIDDPLSVSGANYRSSMARLDWTLVVDRNAVTLLAADGRIVLSSLRFPDEAFSSFELFAEKHPIHLKAGEFILIKQ